MNTKTLALAALTFVALCACGGYQEKVYAVAIDRSPLMAISNTDCFKGRQLNTSRVSEQEQFYKDDANWGIWDGPDQKQYLDIGSAVKFKLGDAPLITVTDLLEGEQKQFQGTRTTVHPGEEGNQTTIIRNTKVVIDFEELSALARGTITLSSSWACNSQTQGACPQAPFAADAASCQGISLPFVGRRLDYASLGPVSTAGRTENADSNSITPWQ